MDGIGQDESQGGARNRQTFLMLGKNKERREKVSRTLPPLYFMRIVSVLTLNCLRCDLSQVLGLFSVLKEMIMWTCAASSNIGEMNQLQIIFAGLNVKCVSFSFLGRLLAGLWQQCDMSNVSWNRRYPERCQASKQSLYSSWRRCKSTQIGSVNCSPPENLLNGLAVKIVLVLAVKTGLQVLL